jgi:hypothetical protein
VQAFGQDISGVAALVPVTVPVGSHPPGDLAVEAFLYAGEQVRIQVMVALGFGVGDRGACLAQDLLGPPGPRLMVVVSGRTRLEDL